MNTGILSVQGNFSEHFNALKKNGFGNVVFVKEKKDFKKLDFLIIPGGESTSIMRQIDYYDLRESINDFYNSGNYIWGTCAGMIVISKEITEFNRFVPLNLIDITVSRNFFGSQIRSFTAYENIKYISGKTEMKFIRAPVIEKYGNSVEVLSVVSGHTVAAKTERILVTSFHPEISSDNTMFYDFLKNNFIGNAENKLQD
ncbi:MAG TPA: pyridoxal 5'-phosphate synthase glutaminase subunit PdxT [Tepiditoga sp.]|nr:pyridoxal 5'-phosphate synthase glutaminase subunit PdxT [Tepiditoga sp.]